MMKKLFLNGTVLIMCLFLFAGTLSAQSKKAVQIKSNGTWTVPTTLDGKSITVTSVTFEAWGGGGAGGFTTGGHAITDMYVSGGGGGGAYGKTVINDPVAGEEFTITVGAGGYNTADDDNSILCPFACFKNYRQADGGMSSVKRGSNTILEAMGGKTCAGQDNVTGADGGADTGAGDSHFAGGKGGNASQDCTLAGRRSSGSGGGAAGPNGNGGNAENATCSANGGWKAGGTAGGGLAGKGGEGTSDHNDVLGGKPVGNPGLNYGGGGAGSKTYRAWHSGGNGAPGIVLVTYTYTSTESIIDVDDATGSFCSGTDISIPLNVTLTNVDLANVTVESISTSDLANEAISYDAVEGKFFFTADAYTNTTTATKTITLTCKLKDNTTVESNEFTVTVNVYGKLDGGEIAKDQYVCAGQDFVMFTNEVSASGGKGGQYQWYISDNNSSYSYIAGANSATYTPTELGAHFYRRAYIDECGTEYAHAAGYSVAVRYLDAFNVNPFDPGKMNKTDVVFCPADATDYTTTLTASPSSTSINPSTYPYTTLYQIYWQKSTDGGTTWTDVYDADYAVNPNYTVNIPAADMVAGTTFKYRYMVELYASALYADCPLVPCNDVFTVTVKDVPDYTSQFKNDTITLWYGACDTSIVGKAVPSLNPAPESVTGPTCSEGTRLAPGTYDIVWTVTYDGCPREYTQSLTVEYPACGTLTAPYSTTDDDGNEYQTIRIGCDCWFAENLITNADDASYYNDDDANESFGKLYTWQAAVGNNNEEHPTKLGTTFIQGLCPDGWAIPSVAQYNTMFAAAGGNTSAVMSDDESTWLPGYAGTNTSGFAAMGAGYYEGVQYQRQLGYTYFWTADLNPSNSTVAKVFELRCGCDAFTCKEKNKADKLSVRCVRVEPGDITPPSTCPSLGATTLKIDDPVVNGYGYLSDGTFTISTPIVNYDASLIMEGWYKITIGTAAPEWFLGTVSASGLVATLQYSDLKDINDALYYDETVTITPVLTVTCTDPSGVDIEGVGKTFDATCPDYYYYGISYPAPDKIVVVAEVDNYSATAVDPDQIAWTITSNIASQPPYIFASVDNNTDTDPGPDHVAIIDGDYQIGEISMDIINTLFPGATNYTFVPSMVVTCNSTTKTVGGPVITFSLPDFSDCPVLASTPTFGLNSGQYTADISYTGTDAFEVHGFYALSRNYDDKYSISLLWYTINSTDKKLEIHIPTNADSYISSLASGETLRVVLNISYGPCPEQNVILEYTKP